MVNGPNHFCRLFALIVRHDLSGPMNSWGGNGSAGKGYRGWEGRERKGKQGKVERRKGREERRGRVSKSEGDVR